MSLPIFHVDAFTDRPFAGNPAAVCLLTKRAPAAWMQSLAAEMNLPETAFVQPRTPDPEPGFDLRWFTPVTEVDLCGHATLASAHVLWQEAWLAPEAQARFYTRSGLLTARRVDGRIVMDFPARPARSVAAPAGLLEALAVQARYVGYNGADFLVELESAEAVRCLRPQLAQLRQIPGRGFIVTAPGDQADYDFVSRFFAPGVGIDEDPVTGSAHCCLGPHWQWRLGRSELVGWQASARGGCVYVQVLGTRVLLGGHAVTVFGGALSG
jgi:PhzF family phenazine biosynthesis protein